MEECGDATRDTHQCDDGNQTDGDGCDSSCSVEPGYICEGGGPTAPDSCLAIEKVKIASIAISKEFMAEIQLSAPLQCSSKSHLNFLDL